VNIVGVFDRGMPNQERIVLLVNEPVDMGQYGILLGVRAQGRFAYPIRDNFYWFGDGFVSKGDWIFVYTGPGESRTAELPNNRQKLYSVHWGRDKTILHQSEIIPILFRVDAVDVHLEMQETPKALSKLQNKQIT
jgi:hypothetical protein